MPEETSESIEDQWYAAYQAEGGQHDRATFDRNRLAFVRLTLDAYVRGIGDRDRAWARWVRFIGSRVEARRYFCAIDAVTPYS